MTEPVDPTAAPLDDGPLTTDVADASTETSTADVAARRRGRKAGKVPAASASTPGAAPAAVDDQTPVAVIASRTLVSSFDAEGGPGRPVGGVWGGGRPLILENAAASAAPVEAGNSVYVVAACDASESVIAPNCVTPTSRLLWRRGMRVRRDLYEAVLAAHAERALTGTALDAIPAAMPPGMDALPADVIAPPITASGFAPGAITPGLPVATAADGSPGTMPEAPATVGPRV